MDPTHLRLMRTDGPFLVRDWARYFHVIGQLLLVDKDVESIRMDSGRAAAGLPGNAYTDAK